MRRSIRIIAAIGMLSVTFITGCGESESKQNSPSEITKEEYQCPMKCTEEVFDKPGNCTVCGMELEKIIKS